MDFSNKPINSFSRQAEAVSYDLGLRSYMLQIYNYMAAAIGLTAICSYLGAYNPLVMNMLYTLQGDRIVGMKPLAWICTLAPLGIVFFLSARIYKMEKQTAQILFWAYASMMGLSLSSLCFIYTGESIAQTFFITASMFGLTSMYGYVTKKDLSGWGGTLTMLLIGLVVASVVNMFLHSSALQFALSIVGILLFVGLIAYDTQKFKTLYYQMDGASNKDALDRVAILGALSLYMDFINLFILLLRFFGQRKN